jgi:nucleoside-triphosphatase THEP1
MMSKVFIISGEVHGGKTTFAAQLAKRLAMEGFQLSGFVCPGSFLDGERNVFDIEFLNSGEKLSFAKNEHVDKWQTFRRFCFNPEAFYKGNELIKESGSNENIAIVVDEIGQWELENGGWYESVKSLLQKEKTIKLLVVRKKFVGLIVEKFHVQNPIILDIQNVSLQEAYEEILSYKTTL